MSRPKKNGTYLNVCIDSDIYRRLTAYCEAAGQSKTVAVERSLKEYIEKYDRERSILEQAKKENSEVIDHGE